jgi:hypothetical protein
MMARAACGGRKPANQPAPAHSVTIQPMLASIDAISSSSLTTAGSGISAPPAARGASILSQPRRCISERCVGVMKPALSAACAAAAIRPLSRSERALPSAVLICCDIKSFCWFTVAAA